MKDQFTEILDQFQLVFSGWHTLFDVVLPPLVFIIGNRYLPLGWALAVAAIPAAGFVLIRIIKKQKLLYVLLGSAGLLIAFANAWISGSAAGFFLPAILTDAIIVLVCIISILIKRPFTALTSHITRNWPLDWYWHPNVRPAYRDVTILWAAFFSLRIVPQWIYYQRGDVQVLGWLNVITGLPGIVVLLVGSYLFGMYRLRKLEGPSVEEYEKQKPPPWRGQQKGF